MGTLHDRKAGAILGCLVADAAAQPLHWIYDVPKINEIIDKSGNVPEFHVPSCNPYYCIETGKNSCYGDQCFVLLQSLASCNGLNIEDLKQTTNRHFGAGSTYDSEAVDGYKWKGDVAKTYPVHTPWKHFSIKDFLKNYEAGKSETGSQKDQQIDGVTKIAPVVAMFAGRPEMLQKVEESVRVTQENDIAVVIALAAARILEKFILQEKAEPKKVVSQVIEDLCSSKRDNPQDLDRAVANQLKDVIKVSEVPHKKAVTEIFTNS